MLRTVPGNGRCSPLTYRESQRVNEACLRATEAELYHMGIYNTASRNNLSYPNEHGEGCIYAADAPLQTTQLKGFGSFVFFSNNGGAIINLDDMQGAPCIVFC